MTSRTKLLLSLVAIAVIGVSASSLVYFYGGKVPASTGQNILIVATANGFNDSIAHGVPQSSWPIIQVAKGTLVNITVFNEDHQAHGFQITHYFDSSIETVAPGQKITVTFVANQAGTFRIYCSIFCTIHAYMQSGELIVR
ncbi:MAG TPA: cupredoxin domain-containing protein [Nitrososphaerales archaeon]